MSTTPTFITTCFCLVGQLYEVLYFIAKPSWIHKCYIKFSLLKNRKHLVVLNTSNHKILNVCLHQPKIFHCTCAYKSHTLIMLFLCVCIIIQLFLSHYIFIHACIVTSCEVPFLPLDQQFPLKVFQLLHQLSSMLTPTINRRIVMNISVFVLYFLSYLVPCGRNTTNKFSLF